MPRRAPRVIWEEDSAGELSSASSSDEEEDDAPVQDAPMDADDLEEEEGDDEEGQAEDVQARDQRATQHAQQPKLKLGAKLGGKGPGLVCKVRGASGRPDGDPVVLFRA